MSTLQHWEEKIKEKRKNTPFRDFLKELASWQQINFYKVNGRISRYPDTQRISAGLLPGKDFFENMSSNNNHLDYDESKSFFDQYGALFSNQQLPSLWQVGENPGCEFADTCYTTKNAYLTTNVCFDTENVLYSFEVAYSKDVYNSSMIADGSSNIFMSSGVVKSFNVFYSKFINNSSNIWFSSSLIGCQECLLCHGLTNQSYCISNEQHPKEEYFKKKKEILSDKGKYAEYYQNLLLSNSNTGSENCNGLFCVNSSNVENGYFVNNVNTGRNLLDVGGKKDANISDYYDLVASGGAGIEDAYACVGVSPGENLYIAMNSGMANSLYYCYFIVNCSYCIGCIGIANKSYCIFNKQYAKEEWYELADKIFAKMEADGALGKFFPGNLNPFYFNDTLAYLIDDSFTKEEVTKEGYLRRDEEIKVDIPLGMEVLATQQLSSYQGYDSSGRWTINPDILKKAIKDEKGNIYRIVKMEYDFLVKHELPLPELHWMDRIKLGFKF